MESAFKNFFLPIFTINSNALILMYCNSESSVQAQNVLIPLSLQQPSEMFEERNPMVTKEIKMKNKIEKENEIIEVQSGNSLSENIKVEKMNIESKGKII